MHNKVLTNPNMKHNGHRIRDAVDCCNHFCLASALSLSIPVMTGISERMRPTRTTPAAINFTIVGFFRKIANLLN